MDRTINFASFFFFKYLGLKKVEVGGWVWGWLSPFLFYDLPPVRVWGNVQASL